MAPQQDPAMPLPERVAAFAEETGFGAITGHENLTGGLINITRRVTTTSGATFVLKQGTGLPADLYIREAEGLRTLEAAGARVPHVLAVDATFLALEDLGVPPLDLDWEELGRGLARQHLVRSDRFGFDTDNYAGLLPQRNPWTEDGHEFYARYRILDFLEEPLLQTHMPPEDVRRMERLAERLPQLVPAQPASLLHGDLWVVTHEEKLIGNVVVDGQGRPTLIDPCVHYGWAEAELGMTQLYGQNIPRSFWDAYLEINPLDDGWEERLQIFHIHDGLGLMAHFGDQSAMRDHAIPLLKGVLDRFS